MAIEHVIVALLSALLHAGWNAVVKASPRPSEAMAAQMMLAAGLTAPALIWTGLPATAAWLWIGLSTSMNLLTVAALLRAYELAGFGTVYPVTRALSVLLVVPLATWISGDRVGVAAVVGIGMMSGAFVLLAITARRSVDQPGAAMGWTFFAGLATAAYVICDAQGVRASGSAWAYGCTVSITNALAMSWRLRRLGSPIGLVRRNLTIAIPAALASTASYLAILWVWSHAPIAPSAALRDMSAIFAVVIAVIWLKEPLTRWRLIALLLAASAVPLLRLA